MKTLQRLKKQSKMSCFLVKHQFGEWEPFIKLNDRHVIHHQRACQNCGTKEFKSDLVDLVAIAEEQLQVQAREALLRRNMPKHVMFEHTQKIDAVTRKPLRELSFYDRINQKWVKQTI